MMKWKLSIGGKDKRRGSRLVKSGRRVTGVVTDLPVGVKLTVALVACVAVLLLGVWGVWHLFIAYYFKAQSLFVLRDLRSSVMIVTGRTLTPDLICEKLGLREGVNLFSIPIEKKRRELLEQAPNIREISIVRRMPDKLSITIVEREPIARVGSHGRVVDEEGVVFIRYAGTGGLPLIKGAEFSQIKPGERLHGNEFAAARLIHSTLRPECSMRLLAVDATKQDYLLLTFSDYRQAKFSWRGMSNDLKETDGLMQQRFDKLTSTMESEIGRSRMMWDATLPDDPVFVIHAMPMGVQ
jgi:hypothetical protein